MFSVLSATPPMQIKSYKSIAFYEAFWLVLSVGAEKVKAHCIEHLKEMWFQKASDYYISQLLHIL